MNFNVISSEQRGSNSNAIEPLEPRSLLTAMPSLVEVPISALALAADPQLANFRSFDVVMTLSAGDRFVSAGLDVALTAGQFYRNGVTFTPATAEWSTHPNRRFATFICLNDFDAPSAALPWVENALPILSATRLQAAWVKFGGTPAGATNFTIARITVSSNAVGTLIGETFGTDNLFVSTPIVDSILPSARPLGWVRGQVRLQGTSQLLNGAIVYDDIDGDAQRDADEPFAPMSNGKYALLLAPGTHHVRAEVADQYTVITPSGGQHVITIADDQVISGLDFIAQEQSNGIVSGQVRSFDPLDAAASVPSPGVVVFIDVNINGILDAAEPTATTTADGTYAIGNLAAGTLVVREIVPTGFAPVDDDPTRVVTLGQNQSIGGIDFVHFQNSTGAARGVVRRDPGSPGGATPLAGWTVFLDGNFNGALDAGEVSAVTGGNGAYDLRATPGTYRLRVVLQPDFTVTSPDGGSYALAIAGGFASGPFGFSIQPVVTLGRLLGTVSRPVAEVLAGAPVGLAGWTAFIDADRDGTLDTGEPRTTTNAAGAYAFSNLPAGQYSLRVNKPAGWRVVSNTPTAQSIDLAAGQQLGSRDFLYTNRIMIAGVVFEDKNANGVKDAGENGVRGRRVWVDLNNDGLISAGEPGGYVGQKGLWGFEQLLAGTYTVRVEEITGWRNTGTGAFTVTLAAGKVKVGVPFGQQKIVPVAGSALPTPRNIGILRPQDDLSSVWARLA